MLGYVLHVDAVGLEVAARPHLLVLVAVSLGEAELLADEDLLPARELELAPPQGLDNLGLELVVTPHREKDLSNPHSSCSSMSFAVGSPHSGLEPISSSTGQHFVDPKHVERMDANPDVEAFLATVLDEILVAADPRGLESLGGELLQLVGHKVDREGELVDSSLLPSQVKDPDLGVGLVLAVTIAFCRTPAHLA